MPNHRPERHTREILRRSQHREQRWIHNREEKLHLSRGRARLLQHTHPASHQKLVPELNGGVVEGELLTAQVVYRRVALQVQEQVIGEANLPWLLLKQRKQRSPFQRVDQRLQGQPRDRGGCLLPTASPCLSLSFA